MANNLLGWAREYACQNAPLVILMRNQLWESLIFGHKEANAPLRARKWPLRPCCPLPTSTASVWTTPLSQMCVHTRLCVYSHLAPLQGCPTCLGYPAHLPILPVPPWTRVKRHSLCDAFWDALLQLRVLAPLPPLCAPPAVHPSSLRVFSEHPGAPDGCQALGRGWACGDN